MMLPHPSLFWIWSTSGSKFFFMVTLAIYKMGVIDPYLTAFSLAPILSNIVFMRFAMPRMHKYSRAQQDKLGILTNKITESFVNIHIIQK